jgi:drug/metabolite transporter (DMT)-like permease
VLAFAALYIFWGSTYLGSKFAMVSFPPYLLGGIRFVVAGALLGAWLLATGRAPMAAFRRLRWWCHAAVSGVLFFAVANGLVSMGVLRVPSGLAALVVGLTSVWIVLFDRVLSRAGAPPWTIATGLAMGVAGVAVLGGPSWTGPEGELDTVGLAMVAASTLAWAVATVFTTRAARPPSLLAASAMQMVAGGTAMFLASLAFERSAWPAPAEVAWSAVGAIAYLVVFGSLVGFTAYVFLLEHVSATAVATYAYVNPLVALLLGAVLAGERVPVRTWFAAPLILGAVALMQAVRPPKRNQPPVDEE